MIARDVEVESWADLFNLHIGLVIIPSTYQLLANWGRSFPDSDAILGPGRTPLTCGRSFAHTREVGTCLNMPGTHRNDKMVIIVPKGPAMAVGIFIIASAARATPWKPDYDDSEFEFHIWDLDARALMVQAEVASPAVTEWSSASC